MSPTHHFAPLMSVVQAGLPVEYGVNYAGLRYLKEEGRVSEAEAEALAGGAVPAPYKPAGVRSGGPKSAELR